MCQLRMQELDGLCSRWAVLAAGQQQAGLTVICMTSKPEQCHADLGCIGAAVADRVVQPACHTFS